MKLRETLAAIVLLSFGALAFAEEADPPAVAGRLNYIAGAVSFAPAEANEDWVAAELNRPVTTGDRLWTNGDGRLELHVGSLAIRAAAQTSLDVLNLDDRTIQLRLAQGAASLRVRTIAPDQRLEIATPAGAVVVTRPGVYRVNVDPAGTVAAVTVRGGGAAMVYAPDSTFTVADGQQATISASRREVGAAPSADEFDGWAAARDRRENQVASGRYVSPEMTGYEDLDAYGTWDNVPEYGPVWVPSAVPTGWAPYRDGHWVWIAPWGWTWVDNAPWGFAPFHYGRWVWLHSRWAWAPGQRAPRPVYSPAMVAFVGGSGFSVAVSAGRAPAVGWFPLGWHDPFIPWYRTSRTYVRRVNVTHVTNVTVVNSVRYVNRWVPSAVTVVPRATFVGARPVRNEALANSKRMLSTTSVTRGSPVPAPARTSFAAPQPGARPPAAAVARVAVAVSAPPAPARTRLAGGKHADNRVSVRAGESPRVRVIDRREHAGEPPRSASGPAQRTDLRASAAQNPAQQAEQQRQQAAEQRRAQEAEVQQRQAQDRARQAEQQREQAAERRRAQQAELQQREAQQRAQHVEQQRRQAAEQHRAQQAERQQRQAQQRAQQAEQQRQQHAQQAELQQRQAQQRAQQVEQQHQRQADQHGAAKPPAEPPRAKGGRERPHAKNAEKG